MANLPEKNITLVDEITNIPANSKIFINANGEFKQTNIENIVKDSVVVDDALSSTSENPVQNKIINSALNEVSGRVDQIANNQIPEEYVKNVVDEYVNNNSSGFATASDISRLSNEIEELIDEISVYYDSGLKVKWGNTTTGINPILTDIYSFVYVTIPIEELENNLYFYSKNKKYYAMHIITYYNENDVIIGKTDDWTSVSNNDVIVRKASEILKLFPDTKKISLNLMYTTDGNKVNRVEGEGLFSLDDFVFRKKEIGQIPKVIRVGSDGDFETISEAVNSARDGDTILVYQGVYEETVHAWRKNVHIVGINKNTCILKNGLGDYLNPPLEMNKGSISNMTIIADTYNSTSSEDDNTVSKAYGIHVECENDTEYSLRIENCIIKAKWNACIGLGVRYNQTVIIKNCELETECSKSWTSSTNEWVKQGAIFFHNDAENTNMSVKNNSNIIIDGCIIKGKNASLTMYSVENGNDLSATFINNTLYDKENGVSSNTIYRRQNVNTELCGSYVKLNIMSHGNNIDELNYKNI